MPNAVIKYHKIETVDSAHPVLLNSIRIKQFLMIMTVMMTTTTTTNKTVSSLFDI